MKRKGAAALLLCVFLSGTVLFSGKGAGAEVLMESPGMVKQVQEALNQAGFDCGTADGIMGPATKKAVADFRKANALKEGEEIDEELFTKLGLSLPYSFTPLSEEEAAQEVPEQQAFFSAVSKILLLERVGNASFAAFGNPEKKEEKLTVEAEYRTADGRRLVVSGKYNPEETPCWAVRSVLNMENLHYYYLDKELEGRYDLYDYGKEEIIVPKKDGEQEMEMEQEQEQGQEQE